MEDLSIFQHKLVPAATTGELGARGERLAYDFLRRQNFRIVCANFKIPVGRNRRGALVTGEIDLIAYDGDTLCFIEVKTRSSADFAAPLAAVDLRKQRQIIRAARQYRKIFRLHGTAVRYDVAGIVLPDSGETAAEIELFRGFFNERKFAAKNWFEA